MGRTGMDFRALVADEGPTSTRRFSSTRGAEMITDNRVADFICSNQKKKTVILEI